MAKKRETYGLDVPPGWEVSKLVFAKPSPELGPDAYVVRRFSPASGLIEWCALVETSRNGVPVVRQEFTGQDLASAFAAAEELLDELEAPR